MTIRIGEYTRKKAKEVYYHIQTNERMELKAKSRWDILSNMQDVANLERDKFYAITEENYYHRWIYLMDHIKDNRRDINADKVLLAMYRLDRKESLKIWGDQSEKECKECSERRLENE